jgi:formate dehydrogenase maturation protein FdhE
MKTVYGDRICPVCHGIVPKGVVIRERHGQRRRYFDTEACAVKWASRRAGVDFDSFEQVENLFERVELK